MKKWAIYLMWRKCRQHIVEQQVLRPSSAEAKRISCQMVSDVWNTHDEYWVFMVVSFLLDVSYLSSDLCCYITLTLTQFEMPTIEWTNICVDSLTVTTGYWQHFQYSLMFFCEYTLIQNNCGKILLCAVLCGDTLAKRSLNFSL